MTLYLSFMLLFEGLFSFRREPVINVCQYRTYMFELLHLHNHTDWYMFQL